MKTSNLDENPCLILSTILQQVYLAWQNANYAAHSYYRLQTICRSNKCKNFDIPCMVKSHFITNDEIFLKIT